MLVSIFAGFLGLAVLAQEDGPSDRTVLETCLAEAETGGAVRPDAARCIGTVAEACMQKSSGGSQAVAACYAREREVWFADVQALAMGGIFAPGQAEWDTYREAQCRTEASEHAGGSFEAAATEVCMNRITALRALELRAGAARR
ncbi:MAG: lysozyme inhibitor LprI family protein [Alphaproteobacteria bacterium]|nr:lysozyme inhibitor LprI family protein [Alphaproteobacteria bacterium]